jgi:hypothetical protein
MNDSKIDVFIKENYSNLIQSAHKIASKNRAGDEPYELLNYAVLQLLEHKNKEEIIESGFGYFWIIRVMTNSIYSSTSGFHKQVRKPSNFNYGDVSENLIQYKVYDIDCIFDNKIEKENILDIIDEILNEIEKQDIAGWYMVNLFKLWADKRNYYAVARETNIPRSSITNAVIKCRELLIQELKKRNIHYEL